MVGPRKPTQNPKDCVTPKSPEEMLQLLSEFLENCKKADCLSLPRRERDTSIYRGSPYCRYAHNHGMMRKVRSGKHKNVFHLIVEQIQVSLVDGDSMSMRELVYNVNARLGDDRREWKDGKVPPEIVAGFCDDLCCLFLCPRQSLGILGRLTRGAVAGYIVIRRKSSISPYNEIDCTGGYALESIDTSVCISVHPPPPLISRALTLNPRFVLVVEKETVLISLLKNNFATDFPCILITGRGQPDYDTREFLAMVCDDFPTLPVYCIVDFNPWGLYIFRSFKYGSYNLAHMSSRFAVQKLIFLGLTHTDIASCGIIDDELVPMTKEDLKAASTIKEEEWIEQEPQVDENVKDHLQLTLKADLELLSLSSRTYLCKTLLRGKLLSLGIKDLDINS